MESIRAPAQDVQQQIDLAGGLFLHGLAHPSIALETFSESLIIRKLSKAVLVVEAEKQRGGDALLLFKPLLF
jgi:hypothetical protein